MSSNRLGMRLSGFFCSVASLVMGACCAQAQDIYIHVGSKEFGKARGASGRLIFDYSVKEFIGRGLGNPKIGWMGAPSAYKLLCQERSGTGLVIVSASAKVEMPNWDWDKCLTGFAAKKITTSIGDVYLASNSQPPSMAISQFLEIVDEAAGP